MEGLGVSIIFLGICVLILAVVLRWTIKDVDKLKRDVGDLSLSINYHIMEEKNKECK